MRPDLRYRIVAFKTKDEDWFTGSQQEGSLHISVNIPIEPQWYNDGDVTVYSESEVLQIVVLEDYS